MRQTCDVAYVSMVEALVERGMTSLEAERVMIVELEAETEAEKAAREEAEARAERRRQYEEQQRFMATSPMKLPGMGARVRSGKR